MATKKSATNGAVKKSKPREKEFVVHDRIHFATDQLAPADREALLKAASSPEAFRFHARRAVAAGRDEANLRLAPVTPGFMLLYRETASKIEIIDVFNTGILKTFDVKTRPINRRRGPSVKNTGAAGKSAKTRT